MRSCVKVYYKLFSTRKARFVRSNFIYVMNPSKFYSLQMAGKKCLCNNECFNRYLLSTYHVADTEALVMCW